MLQCRPSQALELVEKFKGTLVLHKVEMEGTLTIPHALLGPAMGVMFVTPIFLLSVTPLFVLVVGGL